MFIYQAVFENQKEKGNIIVVSGETLLSPAETIAKASACVVEPFSYELVNFVYQPKKVDDNGQTSKK